MPEDYTLDEHDDLEETEEEPEEKPSHLRKQIEAQAKKAKEAEARAANAERQLAFRDSRLDPSNKQHAYFAETYQGDSTAEAINAAAEAAGFLDPPAPDVPDEVVAQHAQGAAIAAGADAGGDAPSWEERAAQATSSDELDRILREANVEFVENR